MNILNSNYLQAMGIITLVGLLCVVAHGGDWYVATNGTGGGTSWNDATNSFQGAIDKSSASDVVWVSNGVYQTGGRTNYPSAGAILTNRIVITKAITVRSLNGPAVTTIRGTWAADGNTNGPAAVRCVYMVNNSKLFGFTLTSGATLTTNESTNAYDRRAGGVYSPESSFSPIISNCVIAGNSANYYGGGAHYGTLNNCILTNNSSHSEGGGSMGANLYNCLVTGNSAVNFGGGCRGGVISNCTLRGNSSGNGAGGAYYAYMYNCLLVGNTALGQAGGAYLGGYTNYNLTIVSNSAVGSGGGAKDGVLYNSISWDNNKDENGVTVYYSCGQYSRYNSDSNFTNNPQFVNSGAGDYQLKKESPCVNTGTNMTWMTAGVLDLAGRPRVRDGTVDRGCYEYINPGTIFIIH